MMRALTEDTPTATPRLTVPTSSTPPTMSAVRPPSDLRELMEDTLEQIDVARILMDKYSDTFEFVTTAAEAKEAMRTGKVASFMGIEGAHQLGNSLGGGSCSSG